MVFFSNNPLISSLIILILLLVLTYIIYYNNLMRFEQERLEASSGIDIALSKRHDLINNMVAAVKGYVAHEQEVFDKIAQSRQLSRLELENKQNEAISTLFALSENYPDLKASKNFLYLQRALADCEEQLQASRRLFNRRVANINTLISRFPGVLFNKLTKTDMKSYYEAEVQHQSPVEIKF